MPVRFSKKAMGIKNPFLKDGHDFLTGVGGDCITLTSDQLEIVPEHGVNCYHFFVLQILIG